MTARKTTAVPIKYIFRTANTMAAGEDHDVYPVDQRVFSLDEFFDYCTVLMPALCEIQSI